MPFIGDVHVPLATELGSTQSREVEQTPTGVAEFQRSLDNGDLSVVLNQRVQRQDYSLSEQRAAVEQLTEQRAPRNPFEFLGKRGHLSVESVSAGLDTNQNMQEAELTIRYLPDALYQPGRVWATEDAPNDFGLTFRGAFYLPKLASNVRFRNGETGDSVPLEQVTHRVDENGANQRHSIGTADGALVPYSGDFFVNATDVNGTYQATDYQHDAAHGLDTASIDQTDTISHTFDVPDGQYEAVVRYKAESGSDDTFTVNGSTVEPASATFETAAVDVDLTSGKEVTVEFTGSDYARIDYLLLRCTEKPQIVFDHPAGRDIETRAVGYWPFDAGEGTTAYDHSTYGSDGDINGASWTVDSKAGGQALSFNGSGDNVDCGSINDAPHSYTITSWVKVADVTVNQPSISKEEGGNKGYTLRINNGSVEAVIGDGSNWISVSGGSPSNDTWHLIIATYNGSTLRAYLDGTEIGSASASQVASSPNSNFLIGENPNNGNNLEGSIDDPRIYPFALDQEQIDYLYQNPGDYLGPQPAYALNEASSVRVYDHHGSTDEDDWERVYDERHDFQGSLVVQNSTLRVIDHPNDDLEYYAYDEGEGGWFRLGVHRVYDVNTYHTSIDGFTLREIHPDRVVVDLHEEHPDDITPTTLTVREGTPYVELRRDFSKDPYKYYTLFQLPIDSGIAGNSDVFAHRPDDTNRPNMAGRSDTSPLRNFAVAYSSAGLVAMWTDQSDAVIGYQGAQMGFAQNADAIASEASLYVGYLPRDDLSAYHEYGYQAGQSSSVKNNHWSMPLTTSGALGEHSGNTGNFTLDTSNGILEHSRDDWDPLWLNALQWGASEGTKHYHWTVSASDTTDTENTHMVFGSQNTTFTDSEYVAMVKFSTDDVQIKGWDSNGNGFSVASANKTLNYSTRYHVEVEWTPSDGTIALYVWADGNGKPSSPTVSGTDTKFSSGLAGYWARGSVDLHAWEVNAEEVTSDTGTAAIAPSDHVAGYDQNPSAFHDITGGDILYGTYIEAARLKQTNPGAGTTQSANNRTDGTTTALDGAGRYREVDSGDKNDYYTYVTRPIRPDADDEGDNLRHGIYNTDSNDVNHNVIDDFFYIPISHLVGGNYLGPQDVAHHALARDDSDPQLLHRRTL